MTLHTNQMSDSFRLGILLASVGGFLDAYTYVARGQVFANAQTGNMVLMGLHLAEGNGQKAFSYLIPVLAFMAGVFLDEWIKQKFFKTKLHWRQIVLLIEIAALLIVVFLPSGRGDLFANVLVSFICSLQVQSFRKVHGLPYATTMCTGNLRSGTEHLVRYIQTNDTAYMKNCLSYYGVIFFFIFGAGIGVPCTKRFGNHAVFICCALLIFAFFLLFIKEKELKKEITK